MWIVSPRGLREDRFSRGRGRVVLQDSAGNGFAPGGRGLPVQGLQVFGVGRAAQALGHDELELPAEGRISPAVIVVADQVAQAVLAEFPGMGLRRDGTRARPGRPLEVFQHRHVELQRHDHPPRCWCSRGLLCYKGWVQVKVETTRYGGYWLWRSCG